MENQFTVYQTGNCFFSNKQEAMNLASASFIGDIKSGRVIYSIYEVLYLLEKKKIELIKGKNKIGFHELLKRHKNITTIYEVFRDLRDKGNILKEGLKFGSDFRVYSKGDKPGKNHAKYLLFAVNGNKKLNIRDFCAKARVAHSTNKILLLAVVDSEGDISYYNISWKNQ